MLQRFVRREITVLTIALALGLAAAPPAAAAGPSLWQAAWSWMAALWQTKDSSTLPPPGDNCDRGLGLDPNGNPCPTHSLDLGPVASHVERRGPGLPHS